MKVLFRYLICCIISLVCLFPNSLNAFDFFNDCVYSYDIGGFETDKVYVSPNVIGCQNFCHEQCKVFIPDVVSGNGGSSSPEGSINADIYYLCINSCQNGEAFSSYYRVGGSNFNNNSCVTQDSNGNYTACSESGTISGPATVQHCPAMSYVYTPYYKSTIHVKSGSRFNLSLSTSSDNTVYLCGYQASTLTPMIPSANNDDWASISTKVAKNANGNICFNTTPGYQEARHFLDYNITVNPNNTIRPDNDYSLYNSNKDLWNRTQTTDYCNWHARNYYFTRTGIFPQDGDKLTISYSGDYALTQYQNGDTSREKVWKDAINNVGGPYKLQVVDSNNALINDPNGPIEYTFPDVSRAYAFLNSLEIMQPGGDPGNTSTPYYVISGEKLRISSLHDIQNIRAFKEVNKINSSIQEKWFGLYAKAEDQVSPILNKNIAGVPYQFYNASTDALSPSSLVAFSACQINPCSNGCVNCSSAACAVTTPKPSVCQYTQNPRKTTYSYSGFLDGFSATRQELAIRHRAHHDSSMLNYYDSTGLITPPGGFCYSERYKHNVGGLNVAIQWGGCPYYNGSRLQYYIAESLSPTTTVADGLWTDVSGDLTVTQSVQATATGYIYFRIKPLTDGETTNWPAAFKDHYTARSALGTYSVIIDNFSANNPLSMSGPIRVIIGFVRETLLGRPGHPEEGVLKSLYNNMIKYSNIASGVRALLVMFFAFSAVGFLMGIIEMNTKELVTRLIKIAFVVAVISDTSWQFFYTNFFALIMDGGIQLIASLITPLIGVVQQLDLNTDPYNVFAIFDTPLSVMFSEKMWIKIYAILCSSVFGILLVFIIINAFINYFLVVLKSVVIYLASLVGIALLLFIAPVFIPLSLFAVTSQMFTRWWKYLLVYMLQPVVLFTSIAIINVLVIVSLYAVMAFTACPDCFLAFDIIIKTICLIPTFKIFSTSAMPSLFAIPSNLFCGIIIIAILIDAMAKFSTFCADQVVTIVLGQPGSPSATTAGGEDSEAFGTVTAGASKAGSFIAEKARTRKTATFNPNTNKNIAAEKKDKQDAKKPPQGKGKR